MVSVIDVLKYALKDFFPKNHKSIDGVEYKSLTEQYSEWFNSKYYNGYWFINVDETNIPTVLGTVTRSVSGTVYMVRGSSRWYYGIVTYGFQENQKGKCTVYYDGNYSYNTSFIKTDNDCMLIALSSQINKDNVNRFVFNVDEVVEDRIKYTGIDSFVVDGEGIEELGYDEFNDLRDSYKLVNNVTILPNTNPTQSNENGDGSDVITGNVYDKGVLVTTVLEYSNGRGEYSSTYVHYNNGELNFV